MKMNKARIIVVGTGLIFALTLLSGCIEAILPKKRIGGVSSSGPSGPSGPVETSPERPASSERDLFRGAEKAYREGRADEALEKYEAFVHEYPQSSDLDAALVAMGQIREGQGRPDLARTAYQDLIKKRPNSKFANEAGFRLAALDMEAGRYDAAKDLLTKMLGKPGKADDKARMRIMLGRVYLAQGRRAQALETLRHAWGETKDPADKAEAANGIKTVIAAMKPDELAQAQSEMGTDFPAGHVAYVLAYRLNESGRTAEAKAQLDYFQQQFPNHELQPEAKNLRQAIDGHGQPPALALAEGFETPPAANKNGPKNRESGEPAGEQEPSGPVYRALDVACVLPLSDSKQSTYGQQVLKGLKLAFKTYKPRSNGFKANLVVLDSKGSPDKAAELVRQAADQAGVGAVVGPLISKEAAQAAPQAERLGLPMITVTQKQDVTQAGPNVFRLFLTPQVQAETVARYAVQVLGLKRLAILHPSDTYGQEMQGWFKAEVNRLGGQVVSVVAYNPKGTEFAAEVQKLTGAGPAVKKVSIGKKVQVGFDAVFLPDNVKAVAMISPQFAYHDVVGLKFLGTSLWHNPKLPAAAGKYVQRCVIPTAFFARADRPEVKRFVEAFRAADKEEGADEPGEFEAYGYDAGTLLLSLMDRGRISSRKELLRALTEMAPFAGVTGRFKFDRDREYKSEPTLITIEGSEFKPIQ